MEAEFSALTTDVKLYTEAVEKRDTIALKITAHEQHHTQQSELETTAH